METHVNMFVKDRAVSTLASLLLVIFAEGQISCTHTKNAEYCFKEGSNADLSLQYCSNAIQSGDLQGPALARAFNNRGNAYADKEEYDRAIEDYNQAIHLNRSYAIAFDNRGTAYTAKEQYARAIQDHDQAIRLSPTHAKAFNNRATAYARLGNYDQAIQDYDQAIHLNPTYAIAFFNRGSTYDRAIQD